MAREGKWQGLIEFYPEVRLVHISSVIASGSLFALRGAMTLAGSALPQHPAVRYLSYSIDTVLLTAALMLLSMLHLNPFTTPWLATKLGLLLVYIALGSFALKRASTRRGRTACLVMAVLVLLSMVAIARTKDPLVLFQDAGLGTYLFEPVSRHHDGCLKSFTLHPLSCAAISGGPT